jgi:hypothetical protein
MKVLTEHLPAHHTHLFIDFRPGPAQSPCARVTLGVQYQFLVIDAA